MNRIGKLTNKGIKSVQLDINDKNGLREIFQKNKFSACLHLAGFKSVPKSISKPLDYYDNNVSGTINLLTVSLFTILKL